MHKNADYAAISSNLLHFLSHISGHFKLQWYHTSQLLSKINPANDWSSYTTLQYLMEIADYYIHIHGNKNINIPSQLENLRIFTNT